MNNGYSLPGLLITVPSATDATDILSGLFLSGGLVLSQVVSLTGMESYVIQNWVRRRFVSPPKSKKYTKNQFCRLVIINILKDTLTINRITGLLSYINESLDDESDDRVADSEIYVFFTRALKLINSKGCSTEEAVNGVISDYTETVSGSKSRLYDVLYIMCTAYESSRLRHEAESLIAGLTETNK